MRLIEEWRHWAERAEQALAISGEMHDPAARQTMLEVAAAYEKMAVDARLMEVAAEQAKSGGMSAGPLQR
jgi:hypothetical protein